LTNLDITPERFRRALAGTFPGNLGIEVVRIDDDEVEGRLEVDSRHLHPGGYVHGGVWVTLADTVAAWGTFRHLREGHDFTTSELKANVFAAGRVGDVLTAIGRPLHVGGRTQVWEVRILKEGRTAAFFTCTQLILAPR
jgi:1,4-dihydroxy-2-naphthoyl-CoA hydrolase